MQRIGLDVDRRVMLDLCLAATRPLLLFSDDVGIRLAARPRDQRIPSPGDMRFPLDHVGAWCDVPEPRERDRDQGMADVATNALSRFDGDLRAGVDHDRLSGLNGRSSGKGSRHSRTT